ncbi:MAG: hypothetical protein JXB18_08070 [Sedimentisphaerales bacterium]|nr:hypothetical protein [Sedimentisphaerales bacterium]
MAKNLNINLKNIDLKQLFGSLKNIKLTSIKKYASLFPSIGLLVATLVILVVTLLVGGSVSKKMQDSVGVASRVRSAAGSVPSEAQAQEEMQYLEKYIQDADQVDSLMTKASQRELICYNPVIFPEPTDKSAQVYNVFARDYRAAIESLMVRIKAKDAPSDAEIRSQTGIGTGVAGGGLMGGGLGTPTGRAGSSMNAMVDAVCLKRAEEISIYANPSSLHWYGYWDKFVYKSVDESLQNCWSSQVAYWVYEDVIQTIETLNASSTKVSTSPVKRLLGIQFNGPVQVVNPQTMGYGMMGMEPMMGGGMMPGYGSGMTMLDAPTYVKSTSPYMSVAWTGRVCNDQIDVIHFAAAVIMDSTATASFMKELCSMKPHTFREGFLEKGKPETSAHNQITVLQFDIEPVLRDDAAHAYYRYGKNAVVRLNLVCEYLFSRQGYDVIKPAPVKKVLGQEVPGTTAAPDAMGGGTAPMTPGVPMMQ